MAELIIESFPSSAQVQIDGVIVGTTPMTHTIDELIGLAEFRAECLSGGNVVCSWDAMKTRLEDQTVSQLWWDMTETERRSIAATAIINTIIPTNCEVCTGKAYCEGAEGDCYPASCGLYVAMRYTKFGVPATIIDGVGPNPTQNIDGCYFRRSDGVIECLRQTDPYHLPCHFVQMLNEELGVRHIMCAIHVVDSLESIDNWIIFQSNSRDMKIGSGYHVNIYSPEKIYCFGLDSRQDAAIIVAEFDT